MIRPVRSAELTKRPRWLAAAVILWAGFLGAVLMTPVWIWATSSMDEGLSLVTRLFITSWAICCVPAIVVWLLAPQKEPRH